MKFSTLFVAIALICAFVAAIDIPLPPLPYPYETLEPVIGRTTMQTHHTKHQQAYASRCSELLTSVETQPEYKDIINEGLVPVLENVPVFPESMQMALINQCGGFINHVLFWEVMRAPRNNNVPVGNLKNAIEAEFGSYENFQSRFAQLSLGVFGSGWSWLIVNQDGKLSLTTTANQDTPLRHGSAVILGLDVWEHAYYLDYKNVRADYVRNWWNVVNWDKAEEWYNTAHEQIQNQEKEDL